MIELIAAAAVAANAAGESNCTAVGPSDAVALQYICRAEREWSRAVANGDTSVPKRILADDYVGVGSSGKRFTKAQMAAQPPQTAQSVQSSDNDYVHVRFFGRTAVNQGYDTVRSKDGRVSHLIWTDTWLNRGGRWQVVQSQDMEVTD